MIWQWGRHRNTTIITFGSSTKKVEGVLTGVHPTRDFPRDEGDKRKLEIQWVERVVCARDDMYQAGCN